MELFITTWKWVMVGWVIFMGIFFIWYYLEGKKLDSWERQLKRKRRGARLVIASASDDIILNVGVNDLISTPLKAPNEFVQELKNTGFTFIEL